ncbi:MAG: tripartite tricarboxylate transporter substrate binding protein [Alphaproteobacteria bacterium]|nr:tripartite tricarboxylate transporter substrate binding protein [Alphaproteobacteria bacterium]
MVTRRNFTFAASAAALSAFVPMSVAEAAIAETPQAVFNRPITLIVPFAKQGATDQVARLIAEPLGKALGVAVTVENITGDWGTTGAVIAAHAAADGHTLIMGQTATHVMPSQRGVARYDAVADFTPIGLVGSAPITFVVNNDFPVKNLEDLYAYIKVYPQPMAIAHGGFGTPSHIGARKLKAAFRAPLLTERTYASTMAALQDVAEGRVEMMATSLSQALPFIKAGKVKAVGLAATSRNIVLPEVFTGTQQGFADLRASHWNGLFAPKGLSAAMQQKLADGLSAALADASTARKMRELGIHVPFAEQQGPDQLALLQQRERQDLQVDIQQAVAV